MQQNTEHQMIYVEAVNLHHVVADTAQLSIRRSGSYMLLQMIHDIAETTKDLLVPIRLGGSAGLFELKENVSMDTAVTKVQAVLDGKVTAFNFRALYPHATVLLARSDKLGLQDPQTFTEIKEALLADVRRQQLQTLEFKTSWSPCAQPDEVHESGTAKPRFSCRHDGWRPVETQSYMPADVDEGETSASKKTATSTFTQLRLDNGRELRQSFYKRELGFDAGHFFTNDLDKLSKLTREDLKKPEAPHPLLDGKIAIFYADGNSFAKYGNGLQQPNDLQTWDQEIRAKRKNFLKCLIERIDQQPLGKIRVKQRTKQGSRDEDSLRLETLMWGGDELLIVVPAWLGFWVAKLFFERCCINQNEGQPATHNSALVFAHHNAPIDVLQNLAKDLVEQSKNAENLKSKNHLQWITLESFDHAGVDMTQYWKQRGIHGASWENMGFDATELGALLTDTPPVLPYVSKSNAYRILKLLMYLADAPMNAEINSSLKDRLERSYENIKSTTISKSDAWKKVWKLFSGQENWQGIAPETDLDRHAHIRGWLRLLEIWQYLPASADLSIQTNYGVKA